MSLKLYIPVIYVLNNMCQGTSSFLLKIKRLSNASVGKGDAQKGAAWFDSSVMLQIYIR